MSIRKTLSEFDLFSAPPILRARKEPQTSSYVSGTLSLILVLIFSYVFIINAYGVIAFIKIDSVETESKLDGDEVRADNVLFAIRVGYLTIEKSNEIFDIGIYAQTSEGQNITVSLIPCPLHIWEEVDGYEKQYEDYELSEFFCPESTEHLDIAKVFYAPDSKYLMMYVRPCKTGPSCKTESEQVDLVEDLKNIEGSIFILVYFLDTSVTPQDKYPYKRTLNTDIELSFTNKRGIIATIELGSFSVETDKGIFPVQEIEETKGNFLHSFRETSIEFESFDQNYALIYVSLNRRFSKVKRIVGKIDQMLSYAGGLFSIITGFLSIFIMSYNEYRYELMVAEGAFSEDQSGTRIHENTLTYWMYIKYVLFDWMKVLFCYEFQWDDCQLIDEAREEASSQMDVTNLFRRINSFEVALKYLMKEEELKCLSLLKPQSLEDTKKNRRVLDYYWTIMNDEASITISEYILAQSILRMSLKIHQISTKNIKGPCSRKSSFSVENDELMYEGEEIPSETEKIIKNFPEIMIAAEEITLNPEMAEVEEEIVELYYKLSAEKRKEFEKNIPIKILSRIMKRKPLKNHFQFY